MGTVTSRVLDLDLDFFLGGLCPLSPAGQRPEPYAHPWPEGDVRRFLEENCGLSRARPLPGRVFETHDMALEFWADCIANGNLVSPFGVTHVDAHSDLGVADRNLAAMLTGALCRPPHERASPGTYRERGQLTEANYLAFALAFRWVSSLENVRNPRSLPDMPALLAPEGGEIRLPQPFPELFGPKYGPEPSVPYRQYDDYRDFAANGTYDAISLALSPRYAPESADSLAEIIREYMAQA